MLRRHETVGDPNGSDPLFVTVTQMGHVEYLSSSFLHWTKYDRIYKIYKHQKKLGGNIKYRLEM